MTNPTRDKIIATTAGLFERYGYAATGLSLIVKESGAPRGSLYYYFPDGKEELAVEAVAYRMKRVSEVWRSFLSTIDDPVEAIYQLILVMARVMEESGCDGGAPIATVALEASNSSEQLRDACADGYKQAHRVLAEKLATGGFSEQRAASLAATIGALVEGAMIHSRAQNDADVMRSAAEDAKLLMEAAMA